MTRLSGQVYTFLRGATTTTTTTTTAAAAAAAAATREKNDFFVLRTILSFFLSVVTGPLRAIDFESTLDSYRHNQRPIAETPTGHQSAWNRHVGGACACRVVVRRGVLYRYN